jgi:hypothetical protein
MGRRDFLVCVPRTDGMCAVFLRGGGGGGGGGGGSGCHSSLNGSVYVVE